MTEDITTPGRSEQEQIINIIKQYETAYLEERRNQVDRYRKMGHIIPDFLKGYREIDIIFATDGVAVVHWDSKQDSFSVRNLKKKLINISWELFYMPLIKKRPFIHFKDKGFIRINSAKLTLSSSLVVETSWMQLYLTTDLSEFSNANWSKELAKANAITDIQSFIISNLMGLNGYDQNYICDHKEEVIFSKLDQVIEKFNSLLDSAQREEDIQQFLNDNPVLIAPNAVKITPKIRLGSEYITDFVVTTPDNSYILVEIEKSIKKLYNRNGDPSADLTHAIKQAADWRRWVQENISYARQTLPNITDPNCWVIIGRRKDMTRQDIDALKRTNLDNQHIAISTYDDLVDDLKITLKNLRACSMQNTKSANASTKHQSGMIS